METRSLTKSFGELVAVDDVSIEFERQQTQAIIGPNGAGKTTMFNLLSGILKPTSGRVFFEHKDITDLSSAKRVKKGLGRTFQIINIFGELSVEENLRTALISKYRDNWNAFRRAGSNQKVEEELTELTERVNLQEKLDAEAASLSHGQQRRLELIMVLALDPQVILLDEPTAGVDPGEVNELLGLIESLSEEYTLVVIEHNMDVVMSISDQVFVLHNGAVIADGPPDEIQENDRVKNAYLGNTVD